MKYLIAKTVRPKGVAALDSIENVPEREDLRFGVSYVKRWPDDVRLFDIAGRFTCTACGKRGADASS